MTDLNYEMMARDVLLEPANRGVLAGVSRQRVAELLKGYQDRLADNIHRAIYNELKRVGCLWQFQQVSRHTPGQATAYLRKAIPAYNQFLRRAVTRAKKEVTESALSSPTRLG